MGYAVSSLNLLNVPKRGYKQCVEVWRNFVHSHPISCGGLLGCRTLESQGFSVEPEGPPSPPKPL